VRFAADKVLQSYKMILFKHQNHTAFQQVNLRSPPNSHHAVNNSG
jgi:hypothetical protein